jgi:hypothetical protein
MVGERRIAPLALVINMTTLMCIQYRMIGGTAVHIDPEATATLIAAVMGSIPARGMRSVLGFGSRKGMKSRMEQQGVPLSDPLAALKVLASSPGIHGTSCHDHQFPPVRKWSTLLGGSIGLSTSREFQPTAMQVCTPSKPLNRFVWPSRIVTRI